MILLFCCITDTDCIYEPKTESDRLLLKMSPMIFHLLWLDSQMSNLILSIGKDIKILPCGVILSSSCSLFGV